MRSLAPVLCLAAALAGLTGCSTAPTKPTAATSIALSPEYVVALGKILRTPEKNPLLDEGRVPVSALHIVAAYQNICLRGRYRDLLPFYDEATRQAEGAKLETNFLRQETVQPASLAVLTDIMLESQPGMPADSAPLYTFYFSHPHRRGNSHSQLTVKVSAAGVASIESRF